MEHALNRTIALSSGAVIDVCCPALLKRVASVKRSAAPCRDMLMSQHGITALTSVLSVDFGN
jgi:hypothetical protein